MRRGGVIPPGRLGLVLLAAAMVPIVVKKFPEAVRWFGKKIESAGSKIASTAEEVERYENERKERVAREEERVSKKEHHEKVEAEMVDTPAKPRIKSTSARKRPKPRVHKTVATGKAATDRIGS